MKHCIKLTMMLEYADISAMLQSPRPRGDIPHESTFQTVIENFFKYVT